MTKPSGLVMFDTNILVHVLRASAVGRRAYEDAEQLGGAERPLISVVTVGEMHSLAKQLSWGQKRIDALDELLRNVVVVTSTAAPYSRATQKSIPGRGAGGARWARTTSGSRRRHRSRVSP